MAKEIPTLDSKHPFEEIARILKAVHRVTNIKNAVWLSGFDLIPAQWRGNSGTRFQAQ